MRPALPASVRADRGRPIRVGRRARLDDAQVEIGGRGDVRPDQRGTRERCIPDAAGGGQEAIRRCRQSRAQARERKFALVVGVVQRERHCGDHEQRVFAAPRHRRTPGQQIGERAHPQRGESCVDPVPVGLDQFRLLDREVGQAGLHARTHPMHAGAAVGRQRHCAEQFGEFAGRAAAQQVHLEEALLGVHVAESPRRIQLIPRTHGHAAERVALDVDSRGQPVHVHLAIVFGQARPQRQPAGCEQHGSGRDGHAEHTCNETDATVHRNPDQGSCANRSRSRPVHDSQLVRPYPVESRGSPRPRPHAASACSG